MHSGCTLSEQMRRSGAGTECLSFCRAGTEIPLFIRSFHIETHRTVHFSNQSGKQLTNDRNIQGYSLSGTSHPALRHKIPLPLHSAMLRSRSAFVTKLSLYTPFCVSACVSKTSAIVRAMQVPPQGNGTPWKAPSASVATALDSAACTAKVADFGLSMRLDAGTSHVSNSKQGTSADVSITVRVVA